MTKFKFTVDFNRTQIENLTPAQAKTLIDAFALTIKYKLIVESEFFETITTEGPDAWKDAMTWMYNL